MVENVEKKEIEKVKKRLLNHWKKNNYLSREDKNPFQLYHLGQMMMIEVMLDYLDEIMLSDENEEVNN